MSAKFTFFSFAAIALFLSPATYSQQINLSEPVQDNYFADVMLQRQHGPRSVSRVTLVALAIFDQPQGTPIELSAAIRRTGTFVLDEYVASGGVEGRIGRKEDVVLRRPQHGVSFLLRIDGSFSEHIPLDLPIMNTAFINDVRAEFVNTGGIDVQVSVYSENVTRNTGHFEIELWDWINEEWDSVEYINVSKRSTSVYTYRPNSPLSRFQYSNHFSDSGEMREVRARLKYNIGGGQDITTSSSKIIALDD